MHRLDNKVALVTGAASGIGRATALLFTKMKVKVLVADIDESGARDVVKEIEEKGGEAGYCGGDVSKVEDVKEFVSKTIKEYGKIDIAVNNAGIEGKPGFIAECNVEDFDRVIDVNLRGVWLAMKYEIPGILKSGGGAIVNLSSVWGLRGFQGVAPYVASKHAIIGLTRTAALEYSSQGIRCNCVCPGGIDTPMLDRIFKDHGFTWEDVLPAYPIGRICSPNEVAEVIVWLCSDAASFVTGAYVTVDGGHTAMG